VVLGEKMGRFYSALSVHVVPVIAAGFTVSVPGTGFRPRIVGTATAVAAKKETRSVSCIMDFGSTVDEKNEWIPKEISERMNVKERME
jgi:hypothetical protein